MLLRSLTGHVPVGQLGEGYSWLDLLCYSGRQGVSSGSYAAPGLLI